MTHCTISGHTTTELHEKIPEITITCRCLFLQRYIRYDNLEELDKQDLLDLYYKYIIPLPQRKYRPNRRGREMTKKQIILAKKRRLEWKDNEEPPAKYN